MEKRPPGRATMFIDTMKGMILMLLVNLVVALYGSTIKPLEG
jgi:hypothetical protein